MSRLDSHVAAVQRKLAIAIFIEWLSMTAFVLAVLALVAILTNRLFHVSLPGQAIWLGVGAMLLVAGVMAVVQRPDRHTAAVAIDEKLGLKEKFSTALSVRGVADPFAQAAVKDAEATANAVRLTGKFPQTFPQKGYWAIGAVALACAALLLPNMDLFGREQKAQAKRQEEIRIAEAQTKVRETIGLLNKVLPTIKDDTSAAKLAKADLEQLLQDPHLDPAKANRVAMDALSKADEAIKKQIADEKQLAQAQANSTNFSSLNPPIDAKGPVADAQRQIAKGDYAQAIDEMKKLSEQFKEMPPEEQKKAVEDMKDLAQKLAQMAQDPRAAQKMEDKLKQMGATPQQIAQAKDLVQKAAAGDKAAQQQVKQAAQQIAKQMNNGQGASPQQQQQLQQAMNAAQQAAGAQQQAGQMSQGAQQMASAMQQTQTGQGGSSKQGNQPGQAQGSPQQQMAQGQQAMADALGQLDAIQKDAEQMAAAQQAMDDAMADAGGGDKGDGPGAGGQNPWEAGDPNRPPGAGMGGPGRGQGGHGQKVTTPFQTKTEIDRSPYDEKGKHLASVLVQDRSIRGDSKAVLEQVLDAAQASSGDDIDDSRATGRAKAVAERYLNTMRGEAAPESK